MQLRVTYHRASLATYLIPRISEPGVICFRAPHEMLSQREKNRMQGRFD